MEYSRNVGMMDGPSAAAGPADSRVMDLGLVLLASPVKAEGDDASTPAPPTGGSQKMGVNIAEVLIARGFGTVIRHRALEERSNYYDAFLSAESRAIAGKKGIHSSKDSPAMHIADQTTRHPRKPKISCHFCNGKGCLPWWNMSSVVIGLRVLHKIYWQLGSMSRTACDGCICFAVILGGHQRGQEACIDTGLIYVCLKQLQS